VRGREGGRRQGEGSCQGRPAPAQPDPPTLPPPPHSVVYDIGTPRESFEWYRVRGAPPADCVVGREKVDVMAFPPAAAGSSRAAPRVGGGGRGGPGGGPRPRAGRGTPPPARSAPGGASAAAAAAAAAFANAPLGGFEDDAFGGGAPAYASGYRGAY